MIGLTPLQGYAETNEATSPAVAASAPDVVAEPASSDVEQAPEADAETVEAEDPLLETPENGAGPAEAEEAGTETAQSESQPRIVPASQRIRSPQTATSGSGGGSTTLLVVGGLAALGGGAALAAGGGGSGGGSSSPDSNTSTPVVNPGGSGGTVCSDAETLSGLNTCTPGDRAYDAAAAEGIRTSTEFQFTNSSVTRQKVNALSPAERIRAHVAYGYGLTGEGVTIGVFDTGFRTTHDDLSGQVSYLDGAEQAVDTGSRYHGTHVAGLLAARRGGGSALGIAHGAKILGSTSVFSSDLATYADEFAAMADAGATVSSNSYGFVSSNLSVSTSESVYYSAQGELQHDRFDQYMRDKNITDAAVALGDLYTGSAADWRKTVNAFKSFQDGNGDRGVIVWANSNFGPFANVDRGEGERPLGLTDADTIASLPLIFPELQGQWITVANVTTENLARFLLGSKAISDAPDSNREGGNFLISAPCGSAAEFCLSMDGADLRSASSHSDTGYANRTGTSMATPQVAGAVAILQQAFPNLSGEDIVARLLATADNSWFSADGTSDFGNNVGHGYSDTWGHGFIDLERALQPVGTASVASANGRNLPLDGSRIELSQAFGADASERLRAASFTMSDALGARFSSSLGAFTASRDEGFGNALMADWSPRRDEQIARIGTDTQIRFTLSSDLDDRLNDSTTSEWRLSFSPEKGTGMEIGYGGNINQVLGFSARKDSGHPAPSGSSFDIPYLSLREGQGYWTTLSPATESGLQFGSFFQEDGGYQSFGTLMEQRLSLTDSVEVIATAGALFEDGGMLGSEMSGVFANDSSSSVFGRLGLQAELSDDITARATTNVAVTQGFAGGGLVGDVSGLVSDSFALSLEKQGVLSGEDSMTFSLSQPLRISSGSLTTTLPVGYAADGTTQFESRDVDLSASARELRLSATYSAEIDPSAHLTLGVAAIHNAGHVKRDELGYAGYIGLSLDF